MKLIDARRAIFCINNYRGPLKDICEYYKMQLNVKKKLNVTNLIAFRKENTTNICIELDKKLRLNESNEYNYESYDVEICSISKKYNIINSRKIMEFLKKIFEYHKIYDYLLKRKN